MAIKSGRNGVVKWDPTGAGGVTAVNVISIKSFTVSMSVEQVDVTCFLDTNKVYIPGLRDIQGTLSGFYNSADLAVIEATALSSPGWLELVPDTTDPTVPAPLKWSGKAYMDAEVDCAVDGAPALSGKFMAAGPWTIPNTP
jgi:hypothetical protein